VFLRTPPNATTPICASLPSPRNVISRLDPGRAQLGEPVYIASARSRPKSYLQLRLAATQRQDRVGFQFHSLFLGADKLFQSCPGPSCLYQESVASPVQTKNRSRNGPWGPLERILPTSGQPRVQAYKDYRRRCNISALLLRLGFLKVRARCMIIVHRAQADRL
jgi:hypothetical protein